MTDRLTALDTTFLHLEDEVAHMHVASVMVFDGEPPGYDEFCHAIERRLHLVPRYRQKLALVPYNQGRPRWVDDPHFDLRYHVRQTALPPPESEEQLRNLSSRVLAQQLDRDKPLWELWLVQGLEGGRFAVIAKTHHALVDGVSGVDIVTVLFDVEKDPAPPPQEAPRWVPSPTPSDAQLLTEALLERAIVPGEIARSARSLLRAPRAVAKSVRGSVAAMGAMVGSGLGAPPSPYNVNIGPHRRFAWVRVSLDDVKAIKNELGGTVNNVVLSVVAGGLHKHLIRRGESVDGLELRAMAPVSVRPDSDRGALGNQVAAMMAPLPVWSQDPVERLEIVNAAMGDLKESGQALGATVLTDLADFAPATILDQAARLSSRQRFFNLVVTNVPGPQFPLYLMGREMRDAFPMVPLTRNTSLGIALMSYNGRINFGLIGDYDAMADIEDFAADLQASLKEIGAAAGLKIKAPAAKRRRPRAAAASSNGNNRGETVRSHPG